MYITISLVDGTMRTVEYLLYTWALPEFSSQGLPAIQFVSANMSYNKNKALHSAK